MALGLKVYLSVLLLMEIGFFFFWIASPLYIGSWKPETQASESFRISMEQ